MFTRSKNICAILLTIFSAAACGGGGGASSGGITPPPPPPNTGGITRTGVAVAVGPITGFGSVIVNGVRYDTSAATFTKDGAAASQSDLSVGHFVVITGTIDDNNGNAVADTVVFDDVVEGPVSSVTGNTFVVLGQTVIVGANTSMDDTCPALLDDLVNVVAVEVSGPVMEDGTINASRVECKTVLGVMEVTGKVSNLNTTDQTFQINALTVDYTGVTPADFPGGTISNGDLVEAKGTSLGGGGELIATQVEFKGARFADNEGDHVEVEGFIADFLSSESFSVSTIPVTTDGNTRYEDGTVLDLGPDIKVEVEGDFNSEGILLATKIEFEQSKAVRVVGLVDGFETDGSPSLFILGIKITTDPTQTRFEDKFDNPPNNPRKDPLLFADLNVDDYVEVRGQEFPAGSGVVAAALLERDDPDTETELQGFVETGGKNRPNLTVLGVTISTNDAITVYRDVNDLPIQPDDFWMQVAEGGLVDAKGTETSVNSMFAEELELEIED